MNIFGTKLRLSIFGESHSDCIGICLDGVPSGISLNEEDFSLSLARRRTGAKGTSPRREDDKPHIISGVYNGYTTGAPLTILFYNKNVNSKAYEDLRYWPRPGHADYSASVKFHNFNDPRGGGHFSGRLSLGLVAAGVIAHKIIQNTLADFSAKASIYEIGGSKDWEDLLNQAIKEGDSLGGIIECKTSALPAGYGEPFFDSIESLISHLAFSIPGLRGIEFGDGFKAAKMKGSEHNDTWIYKDGGLQSNTNGAGGINGGISNGNPLYFRLAFKPSSSISKTQNSYDLQLGKNIDKSIRGRHDVCFALRCPVIVESITYIALAQLL